MSSAHTPLELQVPAGDAPTMTVFLERARVAYLEHLLIAHDGHIASIANALDCTPANVRKMLTRLEKKYGA